MKMLVVIPVRLLSSRLPRKALQLIGDKLLLEHLVEEVLAMDLGARVVVATDSKEVCEKVAGWARGRNVHPILVPEECHNGTERVARAFHQANYRFQDVDVVVNIQADQIRLPVEAVWGAVDMVTKEGFPIGTAVVQDTCCLDLRPQCVEALMDLNGRCLSFWRRWSASDCPATIAPTLGIARHVGIYAYHPLALQQWAELPVIPEEVSEGLEQLRPLVAGCPIGAAWLVVRPPYTIDTPEDLVWVRKRVAAEQYA